MAMSNLQIAPQVPSEFTPAIPSTSSDFVVSRRMREYVADGQTTYDFNGTNIIKFTLNSADAFLDGRNSWLQFKLYAPLAAGTAALTLQEASSRFLETGGAHSLFSRLRISLSNGTIISDYDYSQLYAMVRQHTMSEQHLQFQEGLSSFDGLHSSISNGTKLISKYMDSPISQANLQSVAYDYGTRTITVAANDVDLFEVGDEIIIHGALAGQIVVGKIVAIPTNATMLLDDSDYSAAASPADVDIAATRVQGLFRVSGERTHRFRGATGTADGSHILCKVKLFSDFFNNIKYLPLPFLRNLTIELTLNRPAHSVVFAKQYDGAVPNAIAAVNASNFVWTIKDPVIVANLVTPSESLMNAYVEQYNSEQGIMLHWIDYQSNKVGSAGSPQNENLRIPSNCHSALAVLVACKPPEAQSVIAGTSWFNDTNGNSLKMGITGYQFQCGSEYFPFSRPVDTSLVANGNAWNYVLQALDSHGAKYECSSIIPNEYYAVNNYVRVGGVIADESLKFYMAARLDRDGNYTGIDTSNNDIQLNISRGVARNAGYADSYYHAFIVHNRLMRISKASSIVFS